MLKRVLGSLAAVAALSLPVTACGDNDAGGGGADANASGEPVKIGVILPLTGPLSGVGIASRNALDAVSTSMNAQGGVNGRKLELIYKDDKADPTAAASAAQELVSSERVVGVLAAGTTSALLAAAPIVAARKVPVMSANVAAALSDKSTPFYPYLYLTAPNDRISVPAVFNRAVEEGHKRLAVLWQEDAYGKFGNELFAKLSQEKGVDIVASVSVAQTATDVSAQAQRIAGARPDAVLVQVSAPGVVAAFLRSTRQRGLDAAMYGGTAAAQPAVLKAAGPSGDGFQVPAFLNSGKPTSKQAELLSQIEKSGKQPTNSILDTLFPNGLQAFAAAIRKTGDEVTGESIKKAIDSGITVDAYALSPLEFSADQHEGAGQDDLVWVKAKDGKFLAADK